MKVADEIARIVMDLERCQDEPSTWFVGMSRDPAALRCRPHLIFASDF